MKKEEKIVSAKNGEDQFFTEGRKNIVPVWFFSRIEKSFNQIKRIYYCSACGFHCERSLFPNEKNSHNNVCINPDRLKDIILARNDFAKFCKKHEK